MNIKLYRNLLTYSGLTVHTASSGSLNGLDALYVVLDDGAHQGVGETRLNCSYLNGYEPEFLLAQAHQLASSFNFSADPVVLRAQISESAFPAPIRMLYDIALWDLSARHAGQPLAYFLAGERRILSHHTNQTLFLSTGEEFDGQAHAYIERGFCDLKVRVGADIEVDCERLKRLRSRYGGEIKLAADANGAWTLEQAQRNIDLLDLYDLTYIEQPIPSGSWSDLAELGKSSPMPIMLDESLAALSDIGMLIETYKASGNQLWGHIKLLKLGGITPALEATLALDKANIPYMIGQMNEGGHATAAALHLACATYPKFAELYGADGLQASPSEGLTYANGAVSVTAEAGLGMFFRALG